MLGILKPTLNLHKYGEKEVVPMNEGNAVMWSRYSLFPMTSEPTADTEGATGDSTPMSAVNVSAALSSYSKFTTITDDVSLMSIDPKVKGVLPVFASHASWVIHRLICQALDSGGTEQFAGAKTTLSDLATSDVMKAIDVRKAIRALEKAYVPTHRLTPSLFPVFISPDQKFDMMGDSDTGAKLDVYKYTQTQDITLNKIGDIYGARVIMMTNPTAMSSSSETKDLADGDVHYAYAMGDQAFGNIGIGGDDAANYVTPQIIVKPIGSSGSADPTNKRGSIAYKIRYVARALEAARTRVIKTKFTG